MWSALLRSKVSRSSQIAWQGALSLLQSKSHRDRERLEPPPPAAARSRDRAKSLGVKHNNLSRGFRNESISPSAECLSPEQTGRVPKILPKSRAMDRWGRLIAMVGGPGAAGGQTRASRSRTLRRRWAGCLCRWQPPGRRAWRPGVRVGLRSPARTRLSQIKAGLHLEALQELVFAVWCGRGS